MYTFFVLNLRNLSEDVQLPWYVNENMSSTELANICDMSSRSFIVRRTPYSSLRMIMC